MTTTSDDDNGSTENPLANQDSPAAAAAAAAATSTDTNDTDTDVSDEAAADVDQEADASVDADEPANGAAETEADPEVDADPDADAGDDADGSSDDNLVADDTFGANTPDDDGYIADSTTANPEFSLTTEVDRLLALVEKAKALVGEVKIQMTDEEVGIIAVDTANVSMLDSRLSTDAFDDYSLDESGVVGVDLVANHGVGLYDALSQFNAGTAVTVELEHESGITITGDGLSVTIGPLDPDTIREVPEIPISEDMVDVAAELEHSDFKDAIQAADLVSDHVKVDADDDGLTFVGEGDTDTASKELGAADLFEADLGDASAIFDLSYLKSIRGGLSTNDVHLQFGDDFPLLLESTYCEDDGEAYGDTRYMVAPRIQTE
jgi:proliferating cell nuclear antigen